MRDLTYEEGINNFTLVKFLQELGYLQTAFLVVTAYKSVLQRDLNPLSLCALLLYVKEGERG